MGCFQCYNHGSYVLLCIQVNQDISCWDVSNVTCMRVMFVKSACFNQDLMTWNVSNVANMTEMFWGAVLFNQDISTWNLEMVRSRTHMFFDTESFNQDLYLLRPPIISSRYFVLEHQYLRHVYSMHVQRCNRVHS